MIEDALLTNEAFMDVAVKKMEEQDKKIGELAEHLSNSLQNSEDLQMVKQGIDELKTEIKNNQIPVKEMQELFARLKVAASLLAQPTERKVLHHHHVPKVIWIAAGLFFVLCFGAAGWFTTADKLNMYTENDTKYRYLKLDTANRSLQKCLDLADSLYNSDPDLRHTVINTEDLNLKHLEMLQKAQRMENEATDLKRKVYRR